MPIRKVWKSQAIVKGAGVHLKRGFGYPQGKLLDPFLVLDDVHSNSPTNWFPWHPHRGVEIINYMLHGEIDHIDSMGNGGTLLPGDVLWLTTGRGVIHQETLRRDGSGCMRGVQLWMNLPDSHKMLPPCYREVKSGKIPEVLLANGAKVRVVCGELEGVSGPVTGAVVEQEYLDVTVPPHATFVHPVKDGFTTFAYVVEGSGYFDPGRNAVAGASGEDNCQPVSPCDAETVVLCTGCEELVVAAADQQLRFLLVAGRQVGEPATE